MKSEIKTKLPTDKTNTCTKRMKLKPYWNDELRNRWCKVCVSEKTWLHYTGVKRNKRKGSLLYRKENI